MSEFIGIVHYYRDILARWSHLLHPLASLKSNKMNFKCTGVEQKSFGDIKRYVSQEKLLVYPDFNKHFDIHIDASNYQLVEFIS